GPEAHGRTRSSAFCAQPEATRATCRSWPMPIASCSIFVASLFRGSPLPRPALSMASTSATKKSTSELNKSPTNWFASPKRFAVRFFRSGVAAQKYLLAQQDRTGDKEICFQESPRESPRWSPERDTMIEPCSTNFCRVPDSAFPGRHKSSLCKHEAPVRH